MPRKTLHLNTVLSGEDTSVRVAARGADEYSVTIDGREVCLTVTPSGPTEYVVRHEEDVFSAVVVTGTAGTEVHLCGVRHVFAFVSPEAVDRARLAPRHGG